MSHHHDWHEGKINLNKMRSEKLHRQHWERPHHGPNSMFKLVLFFLFMGMLFGGFGGWWIWFFIFPVFIWGSRQAFCWVSTFDDSDDDDYRDKRKNDEKLKNDDLDDQERRYVRTADGEYLEIV